MAPLSGRFAEPAHALLRIVSGYLFLLHGTQKLLGFPGDRDPVALLSLAGAAGVIELVGGALAVLGLGMRWAAFIMSGEMAVAYFLQHASRGNPAFPMLNGGEPAVLFCFIWLYFAARGAGIWSLDRR